MKPLTEAQAGACEHAKTPRCRCRCGGVFHGAGRATNREDFERLHEGDPHHLPKDAATSQLGLPLADVFSQQK